MGFSIWHVFMTSSLIIKALMFGLLATSVWSWAFSFSKWSTLRYLFSFLNDLERRIREDDLRTLTKRFAKPHDPSSAVFLFSVRSWEDGQGDTPSVRAERLRRIAKLTIAREMIPISSGLSVLASVGSISPFVGLFGTVWGLMESFQSMVNSKDLSLSIVAPALSEALLATAIGLLVAIPAVLMYNRTLNDINCYNERLNLFAEELELILSGNEGGSFGHA